MSIFAIGDPHLSLGCNKEMNIFAGWHDYVQRLEQNWREWISSEDTVILAGDISWAMNIEDTLADFTFLHRLPGKKYLMKGNHDYWWTTLSSMQRFLDKNGLNTLHFLHNNAVTVEGASLCGSRGWMFEEGERAEGSITSRELGRIRRSLAAAPPENEKILFLHYPPIFPGVLRCYERIRRQAVLLRPFARRSHPIGLPGGIFWSGLPVDLGRLS